MISKPKSFTGTVNIVMYKDKTNVYYSKSTPSSTKDQIKSLFQHERVDACSYKCRIKDGNLIVNSELYRDITLHIPEWTKTNH